jgi:hypothetical protein
MLEYDYILGDFIQNLASSGRDNEVEHFQLARSSSQTDILVQSLSASMLEQYRLVVALQIVNKPDWIATIDILPWKAEDIPINLRILDPCSTSCSSVMGYLMKHSEDNTRTMRQIASAHLEL